VARPVCAVAPINPAPLSAVMVAEFAVGLREPPSARPPSPCGRRSRSTWSPDGR